MRWLPNSNDASHAKVGALEEVRRALNGGKREKQWAKNPKPSGGSQARRLAFEGARLGGSGARKLGILHGGEFEASDARLLEASTPRRLKGLVSRRLEPSLPLGVRRLGSSKRGLCRSSWREEDGQAGQSSRVYG